MIPDLESKLRKKSPKVISPFLWDITEQFDIASYVLLTHRVAGQSGLEAGL